MRTRAPTAAAALLLAACPGSSAEPAAAPAPAPGCTLVESGYGPAGSVPIRVERVAAGLEVPWGIAFLPGGDALVTERPGRVRLLAGGDLVQDPVATVTVAEAGEGGLLGIAVDPRFTENRRFYLYATVPSGGHPENQLTRWVLAADGRSARLDAVLLEGIAAASFHDGGRIRFGPDGLLYVATGDAGVPGSAQDEAGPNGKILRIGTNGEVPADNPTPGSRAFLRGVRNVEAFDWLDAATLVVADHGPSGELGRRGGDEISVTRAGENLGWPGVWRCEASAGTTTPVLAFADAMPPGGGSVYRGGAVPAWQGSFLVGTLGSRHLHRVALGSDGQVTAHEVYLAGDPPAGLGRIREVVEGPDGALWITTSNCDGRGTCPPEKDVIARIVGR